MQDSKLYPEIQRKCQHCNAPLSDESRQRYPSFDTCYCHICTVLATTILRSSWFTRAHLEWLRENRLLK